jgi:hypothetical protein
MSVPHPPLPSDPRAPQDLSGWPWHPRRTRPSPAEFKTRPYPPHPPFAPRSWAPESAALHSSSATLLHGDPCTRNLLVKRDARGNADLRCPPAAVALVDYQHVRRSKEMWSGQGGGLIDHEGLEGEGHSAACRRR